MMNKLKDNTKIKLISLLTALVLWMYVMAVVDPEDRVLFENIPVSITNMDELVDNELVVYPESDLVADIYISGKLSNVQKITADDIHIYGTITNPIEGNNQVSLKVNMNKQVSTELKSDYIVVKLEKLIYDKKDIEAEVSGEYKDEIDTIELSRDSIEISGPRVLVDQVESIKALIVVDSINESDLNQRVKLTAIDKLGKEVTGVTLDGKNVTAEIKLLEEKTVPINIQLNDTSVDISDYEITPSEIVIRGKKSILDEIEYINTKKIDVSSLTTSTKVDLEIPEGITVEDANILIKKKESDDLVRRLLYDSNEIQLKNNYDEINLSVLNMPETINIEIEMENQNDIIEKSDIELYIDLNEGYEEGKKYLIEYRTEKSIKKIKIIPSEVG